MSAEELLLMAEEIANQLGPKAALLLAEIITYMVQEQKIPKYARRNGKLIEII